MFSIAARGQGKAPPPELVSQCIKALLIDHFVTGTVGLWIISFAFEWAGCWSDAATPWPSGWCVAPTFCLSLFFFCFCVV